MTANSRRTTWIAVTLLLLLGLVLWWRAREDTSADGDATAVDDSRSATKRSIVADEERETEAHSIMRWQDHGASVAGTVRERGGGPIAHADVCAWLAEGEVPSAMQREPICTTSDVDGRYRLADLVPLRMIVSGSAPRYVPGSYEPVPGRPEFQLGRAEARSAVDIDLAPGGVAIHGVVRDVAGGVIEGALVSSELSSWNTPGTRGRARTKTDDQGRFTLWVAAGNVQLSADSEGYSPGWGDGPAPGYTFDILLTPESVLAGIVVRAGTSTPVAGVRVEATNDWSSDAGVAYTDEQGRFRIDRLPPGRYNPAASAQDGFGRAAKSVHLGLGESAEDVRVDLHPAVTVRARVLIDGDPQRPCENGSASLHDKLANAGGRAEVNEDGTVEFLSMLPGTYHVAVECRTKVAQERYDAVIIEADSIAGIVWSVREGLSITGTVVGPTGEPIAYASVRVRAKTAAPRGQVGGASSERTAEDGRFRLTGLLPGTYALQAEVRGQDFVAPIEPVDVEVTEGATPDIRLEVAAAGTVEGRVVDQTGKAIAHARVELRGDTIGDRADGTSRDDGTFSIKGVRAASYRATAAKGSNDEMRAPGTTDDDVRGERVMVRAGETASVALVVEDRSGKIRGRVVDSDGGPVDDAFVHSSRESDSATESAGNSRRNARWGSWDREPVLTDGDGVFELADVSPGSHTVFATRKGGGEGVTEHVEVGTKDVVVRIARGASISGTVALASGGAPRRFVVHASERTQGVSRKEEFFETNAAWTLEELPPGSYELSVDALEGRDTETLKLADGEEKTGVAFELTPKVDVSGTVVDLESGEAVANMAVSIVPRRGGGSLRFGVASGDKENVSDESGRFTVRAAPSGKVRIVITPRARGDDTYGVLTMMGATIPADVESHTLPPVRVTKSRLRRGEQAGELGFKIKESPPEVDDEEFPITIAFIRPGGPAAITELAVGDVVVAIDGFDVTGVSHQRYGKLTRVPQGTKVTLELESGKSIEIVAGKPP